MGVRYVSLEEVIFYHSAVIQEYGGSHGIRDLGLLESAVKRPELYPTIWLKAAALFHGLVFNHAFVDGNKRIALTATGIFLKFQGWHITVSQDVLFEFVLNVVENKSSVEDIAAWLKKHTKRQRK